MAAFLLLAFAFGEARARGCGVGTLWLFSLVLDFSLANVCEKVWADYASRAFQGLVPVAMVYQC